MQEREIVNLSIGQPRKLITNGLEWESGIGKEPVKTAYLSKEGFVGDGVANTKFHGGPERALCLYPHEHYALWEEEFGKPLPISAFGENLTVTGMLEKEVWVGNVYKIGEAVVQVSQGRIPCKSISIRNQADSMLSRVVETGFTGYFCRVLEEGYIRIDSSIELVEENGKRVSIAFANRTFFHEQDRESIERILEVEELAKVWQDKLQGILDNLK